MIKKVNTIFIISVFLIFCISYPIWAQDIQNISTNTSNEILQINDITQLQNERNEIQGQVQNVNEQLENVQTGLSDTMKQIQNLEEKIQSYQDEIDSLSTQTTGLKESIEQLEQSLKIAEANYEEKKKNLELRLIALYQTGETTYLDVLLDSKSITDFISRYYFITQIADYDSKILEEAEIEKARIEIAKNTLTAQREQYRVAKDNAEKTAILLENTRIVKNEYISHLSEEEKQLQEKIDIYNQQMRQIDSEILLITRASLGTDYVGGGFIWPVPGYTRVTSPFGMRVHQITSVFKLHTGTDVGAPTGTNFLAMNSGLVVKAEYNTAYGNMVIIDHGGGITTLYAHGSEIMVTVGQYVNRGDTVLKVGDTGYATGPHAHFEIRISGEYIDPMTIVTPY